MSAEIPDLYTAGYGNRGFESFVQLLEQFRVTHLVDVRSVPSSAYWEEFRRENLMDSIPRRGLKYVYMGDTLGAVRDSPIVCKEPDAIDIRPLFEDPELHKGLDALVKAYQTPGRVLCLMCGCMRPHSCHRSRLLGRALLDRGVDLMHIDGDNSVVRQSQLDIAEQLHLF